MSRLRRCCPVHHVVEVLPGVWTRTRGRAPEVRPPDDGPEAACPTCLILARASLQRHFPHLYGLGCLRETPYAS